MTGRVKVLRVIARLNVGGPARHTAILSEDLTDHGFDTLLVHGSCEEGEASMEHLLEGTRARVRRIAELGRTVRPADDLRAFLALVRLIWQEQPAIVHTHTAKAGTLGRLAAWTYNLLHGRAKRILVVHTFHGHVLHGYFSPTVSALVRLVERGLSRVSDVIVAISPALRDDLVDRFTVAESTQVEVIPLGLDLEPLLTCAQSPESARRSLGLDPEAFVVAFVGRLVPIKDVPTLVRALADLVPRVPSAHLVVVGDGDERRTLEGLVAQLALTDRVTWLGWRSDLATIYAAADIVALSSRNEGTPVALIEAMAAGRPVVATNVGGVSDVVHHGETGLLTTVGRHDQLASALAELAASPDRRRSMGERGRADVGRRYGAARLVAEMSTLYRRRLEGTR